MKMKDYEKAKKHVNLTSLFETLSDFFSCEVLWEEIVGCMDASENEIRLISELHDETIAKLKMIKAKPKSCKPVLKNWSDSD